MATDLKEHAEALREVINERGEMPLEEARQWLVDHGDTNPNGTIGAPLRWGWWHKSDDGTSLVQGKGPAKGSSKPSATNAESETPPQDLATLEDPADQMAAIAQQLGIPPKTARAIATYATKSFDIDNPEQLWTALKEISEIGPSQRKRLWRTFTSWRGIDLPEALVQRVEAEAVQEVKGIASGDGAKPSRRFVAVNGEVLPSDADDPGGMAFSQALQAAQLQVEKGRSDQGGDGVLSTLIKESGANQRQVIEKLDRSRETGGGGEAQLAREAQLTRDLMDSRIDTVRTELAGTMELMRQSQATQARDLSGAISQLAESLKNQPVTKSPMDQLFDAVPGLKERFLTIFEPQPPATDSSIRITLPEAKDSAGNPIGVDLDSYERLENLKIKREAVTLVREQMPAFFKTAQRMVKSWDRMVDEGQVGAAPQGADTSDTDETDCLECGLRLTYKKGAEAFQCPKCKTVQTPDGRAVRPGAGKGAEQKPESAGKDAEQEQKPESAGKDAEQEQEPAGKDANE